jgi:hypothetical protein
MRQDLLPAGRVSVMFRSVLYFCDGAYSSKAAQSYHLSYYRHFQRLLIIYICYNTNTRYLIMNRARYDIEADLGGMRYGTTGKGVNHNWNKDEKVATLLTVLGQIEVNLAALEKQEEHGHGQGQGQEKWCARYSLVHSSNSFPPFYVSCHLYYLLHLLPIN